MTPFGCTRVVSKFESSKSAGFTRVQDVLQDVYCSRQQKNFQKNFSDEKPSTKVTLRLGNSLMKPQCKFETSAKGQSRRTKGLFSSFDRVSAVRAAMATTTPDKTPEIEKANFYRVDVPIDYRYSGLDHCQGNRSCLTIDKMARNSSLRFDATTSATTASCFSLSTILTSRISGSKWRERTCSLFCIFAVRSFTLVIVFITLSFVFILLSVLAPRITDLFVCIRPIWRWRTQGGEVQQRLRASCCPTSDTGHDKKASSFPQTKNGLVFLPHCPASGASFSWQDPVRVGCSGVGRLARFQIFPGYTWIRRMRVQTESWLLKLHHTEAQIQSWTKLSIQIKDTHTHTHTLKQSETAYKLFIRVIARTHQPHPPTSYMLTYALHASLNHITQSFTTQAHLGAVLADITWRHHQRHHPLTQLTSIPACGLGRHHRNLPEILYSTNIVHKYSLPHRCKYDSAAQPEEKHTNKHTHNYI